MGHHRRQPCHILGSATVVCFPQAAYVSQPGASNRVTLQSQFLKVSQAAYASQPGVGDSVTFQCQNLIWLTHLCIAGRRPYLMGNPLKAFRACVGVHVLQVCICECDRHSDRDVEVPAFFREVRNRLIGIVAMSPSQRLTLLTLRKYFSPTRSRATKSPMGIAVATNYPSEDQ